jgi:hypothetical protein
MVITGIIMTNIYYLCATTTALRPTTEKAHKHKENTQITSNK